MANPQRTDDNAEIQPGSFGARYVAWVVRMRRTIVLGAVLLALGAGALAAKLPVYADFSYLLPEATESVRHLRVLEKRARVLGTIMVAVESNDAALRSRIAHELRDAIAALDADLVSSVTFDRKVGHSYAWEHRYLFADLHDLEGVRDELKSSLAAARRQHNPMALGLDEDDDDEKAQSASAREERFASLTQKLDELERQRDKPDELVSKDGRLQMMIVQTPFAAGDIRRDGLLLAAVRPIVAAAQAKNPGAEIGMAGDIVTSFEEQQSILAGMIEATALTVVLVLGALSLYYRSAFGMVALAASLCCGTLMTFAITKVTVGHLNVATAFLASIVLGNGINFGIMLLARQLEVMRAGLTGDRALTAAVVSTARGTFAAAATACVAYLSLMLTTFRGFRDFGLIAGVGMAMCWLAAYTVMPALLSIGLSRNWVVAHREPALGAWLTRLLPHRHGVTIAVGLLALTLSGGVLLNNLRGDPYEQDLRNLRSDSQALLEERHWMETIDHAFGQGISGGFVIGTQTRSEAPTLVTKLHELDADHAQTAQLFSRVNAIDDLIPPAQQEKIAVLGEIRSLLSESVVRRLPSDQQESVRRLRPPANITPVNVDDVPQALAWPFTEADGTRGRLVLAMGAWRYDLWNAQDIVQFAERVRALNLGKDVLLGGSAFVFADMLALIEHDGPRATLAAALAATLVVLVLLRASRFALVTLLCVAAGTLSMLAICGAMGIKVNFLDFVALPITLGIGIDYAVNICARAREEGPGNARRALAGAGAAVCLSSYTTVVGYGSLLLSANRGIRSFGSAAILGELTCLIAGLFLAPALLDALAPRRRTKAE